MDTSKSISHLLQPDNPAHKRGDGSLWFSNLETVGWTQFRCSDVLEKLASKVLEIAALVFALPESEKRAYYMQKIKYQSGWRDYKQEGRPTEIWQIRPVEAKECWPAHLASERAGILELLDQSIKEFGPELDFLLQAYGGAPNEFYESLRRGPSVVRLLHYSAGNPTMRFAEHTDLGFATLLVAETSPGLELITQEGMWKLAELGTNNWILASGDMFAIRSSGSIPSALHRVVSAPMDRLAIAIFLHLDEDYPLSRDVEGNVLTADAFLNRAIQWNAAT